MKTIDIYTDGACSGNPGPGGYGTVLIYNGNRKELSGGCKLTTNNRMEIMAVIKGLEHLKEPCAVNLYTDSRYVADAVNKGWLKSWEAKNWVRGKDSPVLNIDLWKRMIKLLAVHRVKFIWIKGHADNVENEHCDRLARGFILSGDLEEDTEYIRTHPR